MMIIFNIVVKIHTAYISLHTLSICIDEDDYKSEFNSNYVKNQF